MKVAIKVGALILVGALALNACSSASTSSSTKSLESAIDIKDAVLTNMSGDCADYASNYTASVQDLKLGTEFQGAVTVAEDSNSCSIVANDIPNYDFNDENAHFATPVTEQNLTLSIPRNPKAANASSDLSLLSYNAVMLNGVVLDQVANGCYKPEDASADQDGNVANGCGLWVDWRLNPMGPVSLGTDSHNAHTQPDGLYHYHANPNALFDLTRNDVASPVIGFAADGFPIYGPFYKDDKSGNIVEATSGYTLKSGTRPTSDTSPGGNYDGTYVQDYEFTNAGTLDKCNGMTVNGQYGYHVSTGYPYVMGCFTATPDVSFFRFYGIIGWVIGGLAIVLAIIAGFVTWMIRRKRFKSRGKKPTTKKESKS